MRHVGPRTAAAALSAVIALALGAPIAQGGPREAGPRRAAKLVTKTPRRIERPAREPGAPWAKALSEVSVHNRNTGSEGKIRLYREDGALDPAAAARFMVIAGSVKGAGPEPAERLPERLVQLVFRASYHFKGARVVIVSATRKGDKGKHGEGSAIDFALDGVKAGVLASYLRATPRAGVGIYTHPKTQYVHLDVRDHSYHWLDGSPPGVRWREMLLKDTTQAKRDASYRPSLDLPEGTAGS